MMASMPDLWPLNFHFYVGSNIYRAEDKLTKNENCQARVQVQGLSQISKRPGPGA